MNEIIDIYLNWRIEFNSNDNSFNVKYRFRGCEWVLAHHGYIYRDSSYTHYKMSKRVIEKINLFIDNKKRMDIARGIIKDERGS